MGLRIVMTGAGIVGLGAAMLLARDGHHVIVLERDPAPPPGQPAEAWQRWQRPGLNQFRLPHSFLAGFQTILDAELPEVSKALRAAGALRMNVIRDVLPAAMTGGWQDGDECYEWLSGRRPVVEAVLAAAAGSAPGVEIRRGTLVTGLLSGAPGAAGRPPCDGRSDEGGRGYPGRPRGGYDRAAVRPAGLAGGDRRPQARRGAGGQRVRVLRLRLPVGGRVAARPARASGDGLGHHHLPDPARGQRDVGFRDHYRLERQAVPVAARGGPLGGGGAQPSARRALAGRNADRGRHPGDGPPGGPLPRIRRRRQAGGHRRGGRGRLVGVHQPGQRARRLDRHAARPDPARSAPRGRPG